MTTTPLLQAEEDVELANYPDLPSYDEALSRSKTDQGNPGNHFRTIGTDFAKGTANLSAVALSNITVRLGFLRKVFGILSFQLLITAIFCTSLYVTPEVRLFLQQQSWILILSVMGSFILLFAMFINARRTPLNYFLLILWTIAQSVTVGTAVSFFEAKIVIQAVILTALTVISLFIYTLQSQCDFRKHWAALFSVSTVFLIACLANLLIQSAPIDLLLAIMGAALFSVYLVFDIDHIMHHASPEDYIEACISLYLDIINIFLKILQILNEISRS